MPTTLQGEDEFPLTQDEVESLWSSTIRERDFNDDDVTVRVVDSGEMQDLNKRYRGKDYPTNVLTFSYEGEHDIALCLSVAETQAQERGQELRDYTALLLVHAFLHATGIDHEASDAAAEEVEELEEAILDAEGFSATSL